VIVAVGFKNDINDVADVQRLDVEPAQLESVACDTALQYLALFDRKATAACMARQAGCCVAATT
jgi:hypothetical protein